MDTTVYCFQVTITGSSKRGFDVDAHEKLMKDIEARSHNTRRLTFKFCWVLDVNDTKLNARYTHFIPVK